MRNREPRVPYASKRLGQHFLARQSVAQKIVRALSLGRGDTVVEIGAGHGELTVPLAAQCSRMGCEITAIEKDVRLAENLESRIRHLGVAVRVIRGDALKVLPELVKDRAFTHENYKIAGNIPYYLTGRLLRIAGELSPQPKLCVFTLQKEVGERIVARPPRMNRLAASIQFWAMPRIAGLVPKTEFRPAPEVDSVIVRLETRNEDLEMRSDDYYKAVRILFAQPRKTALNNLAASFGKEKAREALRASGVRAHARPQDLAVEKIVEIARMLV